MHPQEQEAGPCGSPMENVELEMIIRNVVDHPGEELITFS